MKLLNTYKDARIINGSYLHTTYNKTVTIIVTDRYDETIDEVSGGDIQWEGELASTLTDCGANFTILLNTETLTVGIASHEAVHVAFRILEICGVADTSEGNEAFAYLQEEILNDIINLILDNNGTIRLVEKEPQ